jgi:PAS domain S-box-containing protein
MLNRFLFLSLLTISFFANYSLADINSSADAAHLSPTTQAQQTQPTIIPANHSFRTYLGPHFQVYEDPTTNLSLEKILELNKTTGFFHPAKKSLGYGYSKSVFWLSAQISNQSDLSVSNNLEIRYAPLDSINIYLIDSNGIISSHTALGDQVPYSKRPVKARNFLAPLKFAPKTEYQLIIRAQSTSSVSLPMYLSSIDELYHYEHYVDIAIGMFYGLAFGLFFYNLFLLAIIKDIVYLYYIVYVLSYTLFMASLDGLMFQFWPNSPIWENYSLYLFPCLCGIFLSLFCRTVLQTKNEAPISDFLLQSFTVLYIVGTLALYFLDIGIMARLTAPIIATNAFCILGITIVRFLQGYKAASYFIIGMGSFCFGILSVASGAMNLHSNYEITPFIFKAGAAIEMIMFSIALAQRISALQTANKLASIEHLERMDKLKDEFLANTSHELRTPLNGIIGIADSMLNDENSVLGTPEKKKLSLISKSGYRLASLVNNILDFAKMKQESVLLNKKPLNLKLMTDSVIELSQPLTKHTNIRLLNLIDTKLPAVNADEDRIYQVLHNLIANAIKFTESGTVSISAVTHKNKVQISVKDTGKGIDKAKHQSIFHSFEQADGSINREFGGTGLGLAITKQLIKLHDGTIWVDSEINKGACFSFTLPEILPHIQTSQINHDDIKHKTVQPLTTLKEKSKNFRQSMRAAEKTTYQPVITTHNHAPLEPTNLQTHPTTHHILVVDDEPINIEVVKSQLANKHYSLTTASNGKEALALLEQNSFDLVLLDIMMPGMSGYEVCERLRQQYPQDQLPVLMLTAKNQIADLLQGFRSGANDYLTKPFVKDELVARVELQLKLKDAVFKLAVSEKKYRSIYNEALEGIFQISLDGELTGNPAMAKILGYQSPEDLSRSITSVSSQLFFDPKDHQSMIKSLKSKGSLSQYETQLVKKNNTPIWCSAKINEITGSDGRTIRWEGLLDDISDQKQAEEALLQAYQDIEIKIDQRTTELQKSNKKLSQAKEQALITAKAKSDFLANMSHEIRNPMNGVIAATDLALELHPDEKMEKFLSIIRSSGDALLSIVNDILDISKLEANKLALEHRPFNLNELIKNLANMFSARLARQRHPVELITFIDPELPEILVGDQTRIQQILSNLLSNAVKFTKEGYIFLDVTLLGNMGSKIDLEFQVKDTGIGMKDTYLKELFEPFTQASISTSRLYGGTGLGLHISKKLTDMMNGQLRAESQIDKGTQFFFSLCAEVPHESDKAVTVLEHLRSNKRLPKQLLGKTALVIDDCEQAQTIIVKYANTLGLNTHPSPSYISAISELTSADIQIDLAIIDSQIPQDDKNATLEALRKSLPANCPIIMTSPFGLSSSAERKNNHDNINCHIEKPIILNELFEAILISFDLESKISNKPKQAYTDSYIDHTTLLDRQILIAEDNLTNQEIIKAILSKAGICVNIVNNGIEAITALEQQPYDALITDIEMPELNGYELTQQVRTQLKFDNMPIIGMTARALSGDESKGLDAGMNSYITKPIHKRKLLDRLSQLLKHKPQINKASYRLQQSQEWTNRTEIQTNMQSLLAQNISGFDIKSAMARAELDEETFQRVLTAHYKSNLNTFKALKEAFSKQRWPTLQKLAHSINGSAANIGANALQKQAERIEQTCIDGAASIGTKMIDKHEYEHQDIQNSLSAFEKPNAQPHTVNTSTSNKYLDSSMIDTPESVEKIDIPATKKVIASLKQALEDSEPSKVKMHFTELLTILGVQKTMHLKENIVKFEYDSALLSLEEIDYDLTDNGDNTE